MTHTLKAISDIEIRKLNVENPANGQNIDRIIIRWVDGDGVQDGLHIDMEKARKLQETLNRLLLATPQGE